MMNKYQNGQIYKIISDKTDKIYIGSTTLKLNKRMNIHKYDYKHNRYNCSSSVILQYDDAKIILIEKYPCDNKIDLRKKEQDVINNNSNCINKRNSFGLNKQHIKIRKHLYYEKNKDRILLQVKTYQQNKKNKIN